ncbi:MAG: proton-translocating transhydrogenase family protein, partial [Alphaproteobacteria bacterium]
MGRRDRQGHAAHARRRGRPPRAHGAIAIPGDPVMEAVAVDPLIFRFTIFVLAIFVGYYVVWSVTPALHTPL